jgi:3-methyladenine DNA glycosylase AlkD
VYAWEKVAVWEPAAEEFVRRAAYALLWALAAHDKRASDEQFLHALQMLECGDADERPLVNKAIDMALRATGKRNPALRQAAIAAAERMADSPEKKKVWIGRRSGGNCGHRPVSS